MGTQPNNVESGSPVKDADNQPAVNWEKRYKDTQAAYTRVSQEAAKLRAENAVLNEQIGSVRLDLTEEQQKDLETLKYSDPDAWRLQLNQLENEKRNSLNEEVNKKSSEMEELAKRKIVLEEFQQANPDLVLTDEVIALDIPKRITNKLEQGKISFAEFLSECKGYLTAGKVVKDTNKTLNQPNLSMVGGSAGEIKPGKDLDYSKITF